MEASLDPFIVVPIYSNTKWEYAFMPYPKKRIPFLNFAVIFLPFGEGLCPIAIRSCTHGYYWTSPLFLFGTHHQQKNGDALTRWHTFVPESWSLGVYPVGLQPCNEDWCIEISC